MIKYLSFLNQKQPPSQPFDKLIPKSSIQILVELLFNGRFIPVMFRNKDW